MLDGMERTSPLILTTKTGQSFKKRYFARLWDETATAAGLESTTLPGSRVGASYTFMTYAAPR